MSTHEWKDPEGASATQEDKEGRYEVDNTTIVDDSQVTRTSTPPLDIKAPGPPVDFPDGGLRAWLVVLASASGLYSTFGFVNAWGVFQAYYEQDLLKDKSPSTIAWIGSLQYALIFMTGLLTGRMFDRGHHRLPLAIASAVLIAAVFLTAQCTKFWQFLLCQGIAVGLSSGFILSASFNVISHWFSKRKGLALGCMGLGPSLGGIIFPIAARRLIPEVGFPWTMRILGFMQLGVLLIANLCTGRRLLPKKNLPPLSFQHFKMAAFSLYCLSGFVAFLGLYTVLTYIDVSARADGVDADFSFYLVAIANAGSAFGRLSGGYITDLIGPFNFIIPMTFLAGVMTYVWPFSSSQGGYIVIAILYGIFSGVYVALFTIPILEMGPLYDYGTRVGIFVSIISLGALAGPPISGAINEQTGGFALVGVYAGTAVLVSVAIMCAARLLISRRLIVRV